MLEAMSNMHLYAIASRMAEVLQYLISDTMGHHHEIGNFMNGFNVDKLYLITKDLFLNPASLAMTPEHPAMNREHQSLISRAEH